jgi:uncharacterized cupredoxin-like copper-binding protein
MRYRVAVSLAALGLVAPPAFGHREATHELPFGHAGVASQATRTLAVSMTDAMRFEPAEIHMRTGETVRIVVANKGKLRHEFVLGTMKELREHAEMMRKFPAMEHHDPHMASVEPGAKAAIVWRFTKPGTFHYACLEPGHLEAGMVGKIVVR